MDLIPIITAFGDLFLTWSRSNVGDINIVYSLFDTKVEMRGNDENNSILCVDHCITCDDIPQNTPFDIEYRMHTFSKFTEWGFVPADSNGKPLIEDWHTFIDGNKGYGIYFLDWNSELVIFRPSMGFNMKTVDSVIVSGDSIGFRVRKERSCELFVNGESKGVICRNLPAMIVPVITPSLNNSDLNVCSISCVKYDM